MKNKIKIGLVALVLIVCATAFTTKSNSLPSPQASSQKKLAQLIWFYDSGKSNSVGQTAEPVDEVSRLQAAHPGVTFSLSPAPGLHAYEFGFASEMDEEADEIIYSNIQE